MIKSVASLTDDLIQFKERIASPVHVIEVHTKHKQQWFPSLLNLLLLCRFFVVPLCFGTDTITHNKFLRDGETLVSNGGTYALGFFSPGISKLRYVGIWYNKIPEQTVVWVANRNEPINSSSSGVAKVDEQGNLGIFNGNATKPVWSTNVSIPISKHIGTSSMFYKLLDTGNLVLYDDKNRAGFLWQSFDYPTHTQLPGMKIGWDMRTGLNWSFTSWKSPDDPSTGDFTYTMSRVEARELVIKKGSQTIYRSGPWNGQAWNGVPNMTRTSIFNYSFVNNSDEVYFIYSIHRASFFYSIVMDYLGIIKEPTWVEDAHKWNNLRHYPGDRCEYYGKCGAFGTCNINNDFICSCLPGFEPKSPWDWYNVDGAQGCVRKRELLCGKGDGFLKLERMKLPDTSNARVDMSLGIEDCEIECRNNCSCTGYTIADVDGFGCMTWFGDLIDAREFTKWGQDLFVRVDATELENSVRHSKGTSLAKKKLVLLCVLTVVGLLIFITAVYYLIMRARRETNEETNAKLELPIFNLDSMVVATKNFSIANKLGEGGFGSVYKGKLPHGCEIAVKRLSKNSCQGVIEFKNEVELIARLQHRNLVQIIGCCFEEEEKMLIYEYLPNKSLDFLLFDQTRSMSLDWKMRYDIIFGIARGVLYLHQDSRLRIIHRDLKASNILLDSKMNPKISDFGMARMFGGDQSQANTRRVVGTYGYMSPEYAMDGLFSIKSDVFSFGVLLLEIISGKKNSGFYHEDPTMNLIKHAWELWKEGRIMELVDPSMGNSFHEQEVVRFIQVGILCVQENAKDRPTMSDVIFMLRNETPIPSLKQPAFVLTSNGYSAKASTTGSAPSLNEMSITIVEGR
ncbi:hypothetical protein Scep_028639 [Stephania cephalantha]|uniref:Receptor-like serine/threonine-protein kinase n=1 Tax=Stephania cephalantha TaxID=152367 RepID=A0AAP0EDI1_9MAGN